MAVELTDHERTTLAELARDEASRCHDDEADVRAIEGDEKARELADHARSLVALAAKLS